MPKKKLSGGAVLIAQVPVLVEEMKPHSKGAARGQRAG